MSDSRTSAQPSIRRRLLLIAFACLVPALLMVTAIVTYYYGRERAQITQNTMRTVRALTLAVDQQFDAIETGLEVLATSRSLGQGNLPDFYLQAQEVIKGQPISNIMLADTKRQQILNTLRPMGTPLPPVSGPQYDAILRSAEPAVADLFKGQLFTTPMVAVGVPVIRNGEVVYTLNAGVDPWRIQELLIRQSLPPGWLAAVVDSSGTIVARTIAPDKFIGAKTSANVRARMQEVNEDAIESVSLDGVPVLTVFSRSATSRWAVIIGIPLSTLDADLERQLQWILGAAVVLLTLALLLTRHLSLTVIRSIRGLVGPAEALGRGEAVVPPRMEFREAEELAHAMEDAAGQLAHSREAEAASEAELKKVNDALVRSNIDLRQFAFVASHDLRTPLRSIHGYLQMLLRRHADKLDDNARGLILRSTNAVNQLDQLLQALLGYARAESSGKAFAQVDMAEVVAATLDLLDAEILETHARIDIMPLPVVRGDRTQLVQLMQNLMGNGLKYQPAGAVPHVTIAAEPGSGGEWIFWVKDNGIGIDPRHHQTIFEVFKRLHAAHEYAGTGIGLALCERIVKRHGGRMWVDSSEGGGSTFYFTIAPTGSDSP